MLPAIFQLADIENSSDISTKETLRTYQINFSTGEIDSVMIDGEQAVGQAIVKAVLTTRDRYLVYTSNYGSELEYLLGQSYSDEYLDMEIQRLTRECIIDHDRIDEVLEVKWERIEDGLWIEVTVETDLSDIVTVEVEI